MRKEYVSYYCTRPKLVLSSFPYQFVPTLINQVGAGGYHCSVMSI